MTTVTILTVIDYAYLAYFLMAVRVLIAHSKSSDLF